MSNTQSPCAIARCNPQHFTLTTTPLENPRWVESSENCLGANFAASFESKSHPAFDRSVNRGYMSSRPFASKDI